MRYMTSLASLLLLVALSACGDGTSESSETSAFTTKGFKIELVKTGRCLDVGFQEDPGLTDCKAIPLNAPINFQDQQTGKPWNEKDLNQLSIERGIKAIVNLHFQPAIKGAKLSWKRSFVKGFNEPVAENFRWTIRKNAAGLTQIIFRPRLTKIGTPNDLCVATDSFQRVAVVPCSDKTFVWVLQRIP